MPAVPSVVFAEVTPELGGASAPDGDTASLPAVAAETGCDDVDAALDEEPPVPPPTVAEVFVFDVLLLALNRFRGVEASLPDAPPVVEADCAAIVLAVDAATRCWTFVDDAVCDVLVDAAGPLASSLDGDDESSEPDASACATPVPPISAAPIPRVSAPAPSHAYGST